MPKNTLAIQDLGQLGYVPDVAPSLLPPNAFSYSRNWRFNEGNFAEVTNGYIPAFTSRNISEFGSATANLTFAHTQVLNGEPALFYYDADASALGFIQNNNTGVLVDTTLSTTVHPSEAEHRWQATNALGVPIFNNTRETPWVFTEGSPDTVTALTNWPSTATTQFITAFNVFLVALGYEDTAGGTGFSGGRRTIAVSDAITTPGTLPDWDFDRSTNSSSLAQIIDLSLYTDGDLLSAYESNNILYINTSTDVIAMTLSPDGTFDATKLPAGTGAFSSRSVAPILNGFFVIGTGRMFTHDGSTFETVGEGQFAETWFATVDTARINEVQAVYDPRTHSVWIKTPTGTNSQEMWIYNFNNKTLSPLDDHQEIRYIHRTPIGLPAGTLNWDSLTGTWDTLTQDTWNEFPTDVFGVFPNRIVSVGGRRVFLHDQGNDYNGRMINAVLRREYLKTTSDSYGTFTISRVVPWLQANTGSSTSIRIGGASTTDQATTWRPYKTHIAGTTRKLDW